MFKKFIFPTTVILAGLTCLLAGPSKSAVRTDIPEFNKLTISEWASQPVVLTLGFRKEYLINDEQGLDQSDLSGKTGKIVSAVKDETGEAKVTIALDNGRMIETSTELGKLPGVVFLRDIQDVRKTWLHHSLWLQVHDLYYASGSHKDEAADIPPGTRLTVDDVTYSAYFDQPVKIVFKAQDLPNRVYGKFDMSGTNTDGTYTETKLFGDPFSDSFYRYDPHIRFHWPKSIWSAITAHHVLIGMNRAQARLAWGDPRDNNRTSTASSIQEQWVYNDRYLYFTDGFVTAINTNSSRF